MTLTSDQMQTIAGRVLELQQSTASRAEVEQWAGTLNAAGLWDDIEYHSDRRANWPAMAHGARLRGMALAARALPADDPLADRLVEAVQRGLRGWITRNAVGPNWWSNQIGMPDLLGVAALALGDRLPGDLRTDLVALLKHHVKIGMTGANRVWLSRNVIYRGLLEDNRDDIIDGFRNIHGELKDTDREGIQPDRSFHQHGPILMNNSYGLAYLRVNADFIYIAHGTPVAFPPAKAALLVSLLLDGTGWMSIHGAADPSSLGRDSSRVAGMRAHLGPVIELLLRCDLPRADELRALLASLPDDQPLRPGNRMFWCSDFMVHQRLTWHVAIKMFSTRIYNSDGLVNNEGVKCGYTSNGTAFLMRDGREYLDLPGVWDWQCLPGATVGLSPSYRGALKKHNGSPFAGGVSDGLFGAAGFQLDHLGVQARLAWFCFDDGFLVLGSGLQQADNLPIVTTLDQCRRRGPVLAGPVPVADDTAGGELPETRWLWHNRVLYVNLGASRLHLGPRTQTGNWGDINIRYRGQPDVSADVFRAWLQHQGGRFAYAVYPDVAEQQVTQQVDEPPFAIAAHTDSVLAAVSKRDGIAQAVFFEPGEAAFPDGLTLAVDRPLAILLRRQADGTERLSLASPQHDAGPVTVTLRGQAKTFDLPSGPAAGSTLTVALP